jgi:hypothetical protein
MRSLVALAALLLAVGPLCAQTEEIQKQIDKKLAQMRKDNAALDELLAEALKNNADIRVAETKVREAEAELYRARMNLLGRIIMQRAEIAAAQAAAEEATSRFQRDADLAKNRGISPGELSASRAAMMKGKADLAVKEAELDMLLGKHRGKVLVDVPRNQGGDKPPPAPTGGEEAAVPPAMVSDVMQEKIVKALDTRYSSGPKEVAIPSSVVLDILSKQTKGINVLSRLPNGDAEARLHFKEAIPLGALFQWAEDQFGWRFIVRDYGIIAVERDAVPPGALLLKDVWPVRGGGGGV